MENPRYQAAPRSGSFLGAVANACIAHFDDLTDLCFVFPNKRSATVFQLALAESLDGRAILAPEIIDIATFMSRIAGREAASRIDMLFRLYKAYRGLLGRVDSLQTEEELLAFDRFVSWGETVVSDFSEVDMYDVDPEALFRNVRDYREISSNFLTDEQLEVIERYFGYRPASGDVEGFWRTVVDADELTQVKEKFIALWKLLPELYEGISASLEADRLAMPGTVFRQAMYRIADEGSDALPWAGVIFVGFNMLSATEASVFSMLRDMKGADGEQYASFFWDATGPVLGPDGKSRGPAVKAIHRFMRLFPQPEWAAPFMQKAERTEMPDVTIAAAPSNVAQTKIAAMTLQEWAAKYGTDRVASLRTAVVVPDENLLMPLLYSLPPELDKPNLTMGYSMRYTSVASFIFHLRRLQSRRRMAAGKEGYLRDDIRLFLAHPLVHVLIGTDKANEIIGEIARRQLRVVTVDWLRGFSPILADILNPVGHDASVEEVARYVDTALKEIDRALAGYKGEMHTVNSLIERAQIAVYRLAISRFASSVRMHGIDMSWRNVFHLIDRVISGETVAFEGIPLKGLQVMGLLETRALDFDRIVILSMNDKVMPRRSRRRTFIPDSLRKGYGLPTASQPEELYSYYFYRLLSRAREVTLIYDARAGEGMRSGGKSRYLMQLELLYDRGQVNGRTYTFALESAPFEPAEVAKSPAIMRELDKFLLPEGGRNLSASALMNYCYCPVKFYYKNVARLGDDSEPAPFIDPIKQGYIVHEVIQHLYFPEGKRDRYLRRPERIVLTEKDFDKLLSDDDHIWRMLVQAVNKHHYALPADKQDRKLEGTVKMVAARLKRQLIEVIRHDRTLAPLELIGGEMRSHARIKVGDAPEVNFSYAFDRVDRVDGQVRIVDYKTGAAHVDAATEDDIFNGESSAKYFIQLLTYARLLVEHVRREEGYDLPEVGMHIYDVNTIADGSVQPTLERHTLTSHAPVAEIFDRRLAAILTDIFAPARPFTPTPDTTRCAYCAYRPLCTPPSARPEPRSVSSGPPPVPRRRPCPDRREGK